MSGQEQSGGPLLQVEDLRVAFVQYERGLRRRVVEAVRGMDLVVGAGEVVALIGASGAGKSLLGQAVLGVLPPNAVSSGSVRHHGRPLDDAARRRLAGREVVLLPQGVSALDPTASVGAQVRRSAVLAGRAAPRTAAATALTGRGLDPSVARRYPHELSGGMARRVIGAMAAMGRPSVVIADEPTPGLHPAAVAEALGGLRRLADDGAGVLLITHELRGALTVADRVMVCERGRTVDEAAVADFTGDGSRLVHPYTRALWRALPGHGFTAPTIGGR
ncbi:ATP-binding cassette domain-containing protein [Nocardioides sp. CFH 31398]|uniref:ATP-binding cassette domain-containing protein n=1 Tax=Nocardioides sp. CFH 31398 TaxID=2919579 RepID=UPI001F059FB2|nr:ATP-binding cassette domain-containing protein [Nocardioides sp. CFH 31398]MCH1867270.1 ATP-binding cassette domain-containing protein [Nocardioides sp. CFH 31398]